MPQRLKKLSVRIRCLIYLTKKFWWGPQLIKCFRWLSLKTTNSSLRLPRDPPLLRKESAALCRRFARRRPAGCLLRPGNCRRRVAYRLVNSIYVLGGLELLEASEPLPVTVAKGGDGDKIDDILVKKTEMKGPEMYVVERGLGNHYLLERG